MPFHTTAVTQLRAQKSIKCAKSQDVAEKKFFKMQLLNEIDGKRYPFVSSQCPKYSIAKKKKNEIQAALFAFVKILGQKNVERIIGRCKKLM